MPTIRQMYAGTYNFYKSVYTNGDLFRTTANGTFSRNTGKAAQNNISSNYRDLLSTYNATKNTFNGEFDETISNLKKSSSEIKNLDFNSEDALKTAENFLNDYNDAINFFNDNSSVSSRVGNMAKIFSDTTYSAKIYDSVGISTNSDGTMKIDEEKFSAAVENDPKKVSRIFDTLANKADAHIMTANIRKNSLFPTAKNMLGINSTFGLYGKNSLINSYANIGNLFNFMF